jgi:hypothetical protein
MDTEDKIKLDRALELSEENNAILKKMHRAMRWGRLARIVYWTILIGISVGAFYYVQPYVDQILNIYGGVVDTAGNINSMFSPGN